MYINREIEFKTINQYIEEDIPIIFINTEKCTGFSSFFKEKFSNYKIYHIEYKKKLNQNLAEIIIESLSITEFELMKKIIIKKYGKYERKFLSCIAENNIPIVGNILGQLNEGKDFLLTIGANYKLINSLLPSLFIELTKNDKVILFIDGAEYINKSDYDFIGNLIEIKGLHVVIGITSKTNSIYKLKGTLDSKCFKEMDFTKPDEHMVILLAKEYQKELSEIQAKKILEEYNYNIYKIIQILKDGELNLKLDNVECSIIFILYIYSDWVDIHKIQEIICYDKNIILDEEGIDKNIIKLKNYIILKKQYEKIKLCSGNPNVIDLISNSSDMFYYQNIVFNYLSEQKMLSLQEIDICYKIAVDIHLPLEKWAELLIINKIKIGVPIDGELISHINRNPKLLTIVYTYTRNYKLAKRQIKIIKKSEGLSEDFEKLYGVILNRCRKHKKAEKKLIKSLNKEPNNYILKAYLVSNFIHQEKLSKAQALYLKDNINTDTVEQAYFYRNCGAAFWDDLKPFENAMRLFELTNDNFGFYTTKCNWLTRKMVLNHTDFNITEYKNLEKKLEIYGKENMHIFYNNYGIAELKEGNPCDALKLFNIAEAYSHSKMPYLFITINKACLLLYIGEKENAKNLIDSINDEIRSFPVDRVKQKYYINKALIYYANNKLTKDILYKCLEYPDRYNKDYTLELVEFYKKQIKNNNEYKSHIWKTGYCPCYLEYWYINPLKLFSTSAIYQILSI